MADGKTGASANRIYPVRSLKEQVVALDAAMLVAVTAAEVGAVHKLRTATRRVEAGMLLLEIVSTGEHALRLPDYSKEARAARRLLRKVRRVAGTVRDLDVQRDAIWYDAPAKTAVHKGTPGYTIRREAKRLRKHLERQREGGAAALVSVLRAKEQDLAASLHALEHVLKPVRAGVAPGVLSENVERWFGTQTRSVLPGNVKGDELRHAVEQLDDEALHAVRKAAKLCRYMAESAPEGSDAAAAAERFEALQEAGGLWHDWLLLHELSRVFHGRKSLLTERYARHCEAALADYRLRLAELLPELAAPARRGSKAR